MVSVGRAKVPLVSMGGQGHMSLKIAGL